jgi:hypothetical protein
MTRAALLLLAAASCAQARAHRPVDAEALRGVTLGLPVPADARPTPGIGCGQISQDLPLRAHKALAAAFGETGARTTLDEHAPWTLTLALREAAMGLENTYHRRSDKPVIEMPEDMPSIDEPRASFFNGGNNNASVVVDATLARGGAAVWRATVTGHAESAPCVQAVDKVREALGDAIDEIRDRVVPILRGR